MVRWTPSTSNASKCWRPPMPLIRSALCEEHLHFPSHLQRYGSINPRRGMEMAIHKLKDENSNPTLDYLLPPSLLGNAILQSIAQQVKPMSLKLVTYLLHPASRSVSPVGLALFPDPQARLNHCSLNSWLSCLKLIDTFHGSTEGRCGAQHVALRFEEGGAGVARNTGESQAGTKAKT